MYLDAIQITLDSSNTPAFADLQNQSGRVMFLKKFKLWDGNADVNATVASFKTSFLVNMFPRPDNGTPGEGLAFLIAPTLDTPANSYGQYLSLTNATTDNKTSNGILAVELDTVKQPFDVDDNHIGLNIHSVRSVASESLTPLNITIPIIQCNLDLRTTVQQYSYIGFQFRELNKATNNFNEKRKLGQGGYWVVYQGVFPEENVEVAVKWFSRESLKEEDDFLAELTIINRLRHKHLLRLLGTISSSLIALHSFFFFYFNIFLKFIAIISIKLFINLGSNTIIRHLSKFLG